MNPDWVLFIISQVAVAAGIYTGIRADLREALTRIAIVEQRVVRLEDRRA